MRKFGKIKTTFWTDKDIIGLPAESKTPAVYSLTSPHTNMIGCFRLPFEYAAADLNCTLEIVTANFRSLEQAGFCSYDPQSAWLFIPRFLEWNPLENFNQGKAAANLIAAVPRTVSFYPAFLKSVQEYASAYLPKGFLNGS